MGRLVSLAEGTGMGGYLHIFKTDAPIEELNTLENISNSSIYEDAPIWSIELNKKGFIFEHLDSCRHVTPYTTSSDWLEEYYPEIKEHYCIEDEE